MAPGHIDADTRARDRQERITPRDDRARRGRDDRAPDSGSLSRNVRLREADISTGDDRWEPGSTATAGCCRSEVCFACGVGRRSPFSGASPAPSRHRSMENRTPANFSDFSAAIVMFRLRPASPGRLVVPLLSPSSFSSSHATPECPPRFGMSPLQDASEATASPSPSGSSPVPPCHGAVRAAGAAAAAFPNPGLHSA